MTFGADDLDSILADLPEDARVDVVFGGTRTDGFPTTQDEDLIQGQSPALVGKRRSVLVRTGSLPGLVIKGAITVDGDSYTVSDFRQVGNGVMTAIRLHE